MAKRYCISPIIGDGSENNPYRAAVEDVPGVRYVGVIPTHPPGHPLEGRPIHTWALVLVAAKNHTEVHNVPDVDPLPDFPLDAKVNAINQVAKGQMRAAMVRRGLDADAMIDGKDGYREVIRGIGRVLDAGFDENHFDVTDV